MSCYNTNTGGDKNVVIPQVKEKAMERAVKVAKYLIDNGGLSIIQAAALVGVFIDENGCDPKSFNAHEMSGKGAKGTGGFGYGAGISSWTHVELKNTTLMLVREQPFTKIETLSLEKQSQMVVANINGNMSNYYNALKRCGTIEDASATAVCIIGAPGKVSKDKWNKTHPTKSDAQIISNMYCNHNGKHSIWHCNLYERRLGYAKQVFEKIKDYKSSGDWTNYKKIW